MKKRKLIFMTVALGVIVILSSCKKDYTCTCTVSGTTIPLEFKKAKKADAEDACSSAQSTYKIVDPAATCSLKKK